jgi:tetratricopeptide (TPR) repeat protein
MEVLGIRVLSNLSFLYKTIVMKKYLLLILFATLFISSCLSTKTPYNRNFFNNISPYLYYYQGIQSKLFGNFPEAIDFFSKSLELDDKNDVVYYELALCYSNINDLSFALKFLNKAIELNPKNIYYKNFASNLYIRNADFQSAITTNLDISKTDSSDFKSLYQLAILYSQIKDNENAIKYLLKAEKILGFNLKLTETKFQIFLQTNLHLHAKEELSKLLSIEPDNSLYLLYQSDVFFREGNDSLGFNAIEKAIELDPDSPYPRIEIFQRYFENNSPKYALSILTDLFTRFNLTPEENVRLFYPILYEKSYYNSYGNQLDNLINIIRTKHPDSKPVQELCFEHFVRRSNLDLARETLEILILIDQDNPIRYEKLISFYYSTNQKEKVVTNASKAIIKFPQYLNFYFLQAIALDELNDIEGAIQTLQHATTVLIESANLSEVYGTLGDLYYKRNDLKSAFKTYNQSLKYNPNNSRVLNNYSYYLAVNNRSLDKAFLMSSKAVEIDPSNSTYIDTKGWVLFKMERYEEAKDVLRNAIAKSGNSGPVILEHYGDALYMTGNTDSAYIYWLKAKENGGASKKLEEKIRTKRFVP